MIDAPPLPTGTSPEARFMRWVYERLLALRSQDVQGARTNRTTRGIFAAPPVAPPARLPVGLYLFKSMALDWLICHTWDGTNEGTQDILIAKPPRLRFSVLTLTMIDGTVITYTAYDLINQTRLATDNFGQTENQVIGEPYLVNDLIYAVPAKTLVQDDAGKVIVLQDCNFDGRAWEEVQ